MGRANRGGVRGHGARPSAVAIPCHHCVSRARSPQHRRHACHRNADERPTHPAPDPLPGSPQPRQRAQCTCLNATTHAARVAPRYLPPGGPPGGCTRTHDRERGRRDVRCRGRGVAKWWWCVVGCPEVVCDLTSALSATTSCPSPLAHSLPTPCPRSSTPSHGFRHPPRCGRSWRRPCR
jgi:hypothetical protein